MNKKNEYGSDYRILCLHEQVGNESYEAENLKCELKDSKIYF